MFYKKNLLPSFRFPNYEIKKHGEISRNGNIVRSTLHEGN